MDGWVGGWSGELLLFLKKRRQAHEREQVVSFFFYLPPQSTGTPTPPHDYTFHSFLYLDSGAPEHGFVFWRPHEEGRALEIPSHVQAPSLPNRREARRNRCTKFAVVLVMVVIFAVGAVMVVMMAEVMSMLVVEFKHYRRRRRRRRLID